MTEWEKKILDDNYTNAWSMLLTIIWDIAYSSFKKKNLK